MKVIIKFDLPDDHYNLQCAQNGAAYRSMIQELDEWLRNDCKHSENPKTSCEVRAKLNELIQENGVQLYE